MISNLHSNYYQNGNCPSRFQDLFFSQVHHSLVSLDSFPLVTSLQRVLVMSGWVGNRRTSCWARELKAETTVWGGVIVLGAVGLVLVMWACCGVEVNTECGCARHTPAATRNTWTTWHSHLPSALSAVGFITVTTLYHTASHSFSSRIHIRLWNKVVAYIYVTVSHKSRNKLW